MSPGPAPRQGEQNDHPHHSCGSQQRPAPPDPEARSTPRRATRVGGHDRPLHAAVSACPIGPLLRHLESQRADHSRTGVRHTRMTPRTCVRVKRKCRRHGRRVARGCVTALAGPDADWCHGSERVVTVCGSSRVVTGPRQSPYSASRATLTTSSPLASCKEAGHERMFASLRRGGLAFGNTCSVGGDPDGDHPRPRAAKTTRKGPTWSRH